MQSIDKEVFSHTFAKYMLIALWQRQLENLLSKKSGDKDAASQPSQMKFVVPAPMFTTFSDAVKWMWLNLNLFQRY